MSATVHRGRLGSLAICPVAGLKPQSPAETQVDADDPTRTCLAKTVPSYFLGTDENR